MGAGGGAMLVLVGVNRKFRLLQKPMTDLYRPFRRGIERRPNRPTVETRLFDIPTVLIRLASGKDRSFQLELSRSEARRCHAICDMAAVKPMVRDRCFRVQLCGTAVHEGAGAKCRFTDWTAIEE